MRKIVLSVLWVAVFCSTLSATEPTREERIAATKAIPNREVAMRERPMSVAVPYFEDFESGDGGWSSVPFTPLCQWQRMTHPETISVHPDIYGVMVDLGDPSPAYLPTPHSGNSDFWYGNPENGTFIGEPFDHFPFGGSLHTGGNSDYEHGGTLTSPLFETHSLGHIMFSFWTWWEVECIDIDNYDMMFIMVSSDAGATWDTLNWLNPPFSRLPGWDNWESYSSGGYLSPGVWIKWTYFLDTDYSGSDIMLRFLFSTNDPLYNGFRGWFIDDIYVGGGLEEAQLIRRAEYPDPLGIVDCSLDPNPFPLDFIVENIGGEAANEVSLSIELPAGLGLASGMPTFPLGTVSPGEVDTVHWDIDVLSPPTNDTVYCWHILLTSADSLIGYRDNFEGSDPLFTGDSYFDYCDARLPFGPDTAVSGFGVAGIPSDGSEGYSGPVFATLTSQEFYLTGWVEAYLAFWYWLAVPPIDPMSWSRDGEDGFLIEVNVNRAGWTQLDEFGVGLLLPRYDAYIDEWVDNPLSDRMAYCDSTGRWIEVASQDLIEMGVVGPGDTLQVRFVFGANSFNDRGGLFIDEFRLSTVQYPIGPFLHTLCTDVPGTHIPTAILVMPQDSTSSSCERQEIVINVGGESLIDSSRIVIRADDTVRFSMADANLTVDLSEGGVIAQFPIGEFWAEGWHNVRMDTCFNVLGCNIEEPLVFDFLSDFTPPDAALIDPPGGIFHSTNRAPVTIALTDTLTGVDPSTIEAIFCGTAYDIDDPSVRWDGEEVVFYPESTGSGLSWSDCPEICIVAGDSPDYCEPNIDTNCFAISVVYSSPTASLVTPQIGEVSACEDQSIVFALSDSDGIASDGAVIVVDGTRFETGIDPEPSIDDDTLVFTPSILWSHGDTIDGSLVEFYNIYGTPNADSVNFSFVVDLLPPNVYPQVPIPQSITSNEYQEVSFRLEDAPAGLDPSTLQIICDDHILHLEDGLWSPSGDGGLFTIRPSELGFAFTAGDTIEIEVYICDDPDLCAPNCTTAVWQFYMEPRTGCSAIPNPFTPDDNDINDCVIFDYPHSSLNSAKLTIFNLRNIEVFEANIEGITPWFGLDNRGNRLPEGIYLYIIESDGRAVCNGSVLLLR